MRRRCVQDLKNKAESCSLFDALGCRLCGRSGDWIKIDVWKIPRSTLRLEFDIGLYGTIPSETETATKSSCSRFECLWRHSYLSSACIVVHAVNFFCDATENIAHLCLSPLPLRVSIDKAKRKKVKCRSTRQSVHPSKHSPTLPSSFFLLHTLPLTD